MHGSVSLRSTGDANLSAMVFPYVPVAGETPPSSDPLKAIDDLAAQVAAHGVKRITGKVVADDTQWIWEPYPQSWSIDDMVWGYGAPVSSLTVNDSIITLTAHPGARAGNAATFTQSPDVGFYTLNVHVTTSAAKAPTRVMIDRPIGSRIVTITGEIALDGKDIGNLAVSDPPLFAAIALRSRLIAHGVAVDGDASASERPSTSPDGFTKQSHDPVPDLPMQGAALRTASPVCNDCGVTLASRTSPSLTQDVIYTLKESQNLHAEMLVRSAWPRLWQGGIQRPGCARGATVPSECGASMATISSFMAALVSAITTWSRHDPSRSCCCLRRSSHGSPRGRLRSPDCGVDGTLAGRFKDASLKGHVFAKTGTLGESRGLSGYVDCATGKQVIVSIYVDNHFPSGSADRSVMDKIVAAIAATY